LAGEQLFDRRRFHNLSVYITQPVSASATTTQIVSNQRHRQIACPPQVIQEFQHLRLNSNVERGRRLVSDQHFRSHASAIAIMTRWRMPPES
jgi:hypothetical protein